MPHGLATEDLLVLNLLVVLDERAHVVAPAHHVAVCLYHPALFRARLAKALLVLLLAEHSVLLLLAALLRLNGLVQLVELERYLEHILTTLFCYLIDYILHLVYFFLVLFVESAVSRPDCW